MTVTAPAGYGKSTTLAQWADVEQRPLAWLNLRQGDNDVSNLLFHIAYACSRVGLIKSKDIAAFRFTGGAGIINDGPSRLVRALGQADTPLFLVLDHAEVLRSRASSDAISELTYQLEGHGRIVIATRSKVRVPVAALRSRGRLLELTVDDLAMSAGETRELVTNLGLDPDAHAPSIADTSAGWPVAVYLLALAIRAGAAEKSPPQVGGDDRFLSDYVGDEILSRLSASRYQFLKQVSPLERLTGPLCDVVIDSQGSSRSLRALVESTHLVHPLDRTNDWYYMNRIVREALYAELMRDDPEAARLVHARAAGWFEENGYPIRAIIHAQEAGDVEAFARLMGQLTRIRYATGDAPSVLTWMEWFESETSLRRYPDVAALGALVHALEGNALDAARWMEATMSGSVGQGSPPVVLLMRALGTRDGIPQMLGDARKARAAMTPGSEWVPAALLTEALAHIWMDELDDADALLAEAASLGVGIQAGLTTTLALAERGLIAIRRGNWDLASDLSNKSMRLIEGYGLESYVTSGIGLIVAARLERHRNDILKSKALLARAATVRPHLNATLPGLAVHTLLEMATAHVELSDAAGARILIGEASGIVIQRPDLGVLPGRLTELKESIKGLGPGTIGPSSLTNSELRLLPLLATHLTFPGIGERLFISRHTVKTEAMSIYRKLGTSSRSEAVAKAMECGLLPT
ncbi:MAG: LuxR C-terminal-related transcriptional regulator [Acidimicrobiia bacterium]